MRQLIRNHVRKAVSLTIIAVLLILTGGTQADQSEVEAAFQPTEDGVPQVAVTRLRELLGHNLTEPDRQEATVKLGEALLAADEPEEALKILQDPTLPSKPMTRFQFAQALAATGRWSEALPIYQEVTKTSEAPLRSKAIYGQAQAFRALQRWDEALSTFTSLFSDPQWKDRAHLRAIELMIEKGDTSGAQTLLDKSNPTTTGDKKERRFLRSQLERRLGHYDRALQLLQTILQRPEGASRANLIATLCAIADIHLQLGSAEAGDDRLEDFIEHHGTDPGLPVVFEKLDQLYQGQRIPSNQELRKWANDPAQPRRALAQWYMAKSELRAGHLENAEKFFTDLRADKVQMPRRAEALIEFAQLELDNKNFDQSLTILEEARYANPTGPLKEKIDLLKGRVQFAARNFESAASTFENLALNAPNLASESYYNASLSWLQGNNHARFLTDYGQLPPDTAGNNAQGDLSLEEGLALASKRDPKASETLQAFLRTFPHHQRAAEAFLALAEIAFHSAPPNFDGARKFLTNARGQEPSAAVTERLDYLSIWVEDTAPTPNTPAVIDAASKFLQKYSNSTLAPDVRMKLAEAYYRQQDFPNAQTQFQILAQENPRAPFTEKALFFAAKSAMQSMGVQAPDRALMLLDDVVKRNGELKWAARNEQAMIERKLGKPQDAATLYEEVLQGTAKPEEKREALCGKGDIFYEAGPTDRENYRRAIEIYDQLASQKDAPLHWRNQALFKKGICLEKLEDRAGALSTFYRIIEEELRPDRPREFFWYYKAGFNAGRLLEDDSKWEPAAIVYQKLASAGGARSDEAKSRLSRLRLEHFLWDQ